MSQKCRKSAANAPHFRRISAAYSGGGKAVLLMAAVESATGKPCPLAQLRGIRATGVYPFHLYDTLGRTFNYSDSGVHKRSISLAQVWLAKRSGHPEWLYFTRKLIAERPWDRPVQHNANERRLSGEIPFLLPLWAADLPRWTEFETCAMPLDWCGQGRNPVAMADAGPLCYNMRAVVSGSCGE